MSVTLRRDRADGLAQAEDHSRSVRVPAVAVVSVQGGEWPVLTLPTAGAECSMPGSYASQSRSARIYGSVAKLGFDPDELVVLRDSIGACRRTCFDLPAIHRNGKVRDRGILGLA